MLVEIRPIESKKWHGKTGEENFTRPKKIQALVNPDTMVYDTGLSKKDEERLSEILKVDLSNTFKHNEPHPFWDSSQAIVKLENKTSFFNIDGEHPIDEIKYAICKANKYVANSMKEYEDGRFPEATHVIFNESEEAELKASKIQIKNTVVQKVGELSKAAKAEIILIMTGKNLRNSTDNVVTVAMDELVQEKPREVLRWIEDKSKEFVSLYALVLEAIQKSVLVKEGHKIKYFDSTLGDSEEDVAHYLGELENQPLKIKIIEQINI